MKMPWDYKWAFDPTGWWRYLWPRRTGWAGQVIGWLFWALRPKAGK